MDSIADVAKVCAHFFFSICDNFVYLKSLYQLLCPSTANVGVVSVVEQMNSELDRPIFAILCKKFAVMLQQICERSSTWWLPVHLIDLIAAKLDPYVMNAMTEQIRTEGQLFDENNHAVSSAKRRRRRRR